MDKIKLTNEQLKLLNDVFNYALNFIEEQTETSIMFKEDKDGKIVKFKYEDFEKDVMALAEYLMKHFETEKKGDNNE